MPYRRLSYSSSRSRSPVREQRTRGGALVRDPPSRCSLLVRDVPRDTRERDLRTLAETYGPVRDIYLPRDYYSGEPRGIAFIEFMCPRDAAGARDGLDGNVLLGDEITVCFAKQGRKRREESSPRRVRRRSNDHRRYLRQSHSTSPGRRIRMVSRILRQDDNDDASLYARRRRSYAVDNVSRSTCSRRSGESYSTRDYHSSCFVENKNYFNRSTDWTSRESYTLPYRKGYRLEERDDYQ